MVTVVRGLPDSPPGVHLSDISLDLATRAHSGINQTENTARIVRTVIGNYDFTQI